MQRGQDMNCRILAITFSLYSILAALAGAQVIAQGFPSKPIRFIVPFPPGGGADVTARTIGQKMSEQIGQAVIIENRAGAGGNIATEYVARQAGDGYTMLLTTNGHTIQPHLATTPLGWDPIKDFTALSIVALYPVVVAVHPSVPATGMKELVSYAKANPGKLTYGSSGNGAPLHIAAEMFKSAAGVNILHVPYKGNAPMTTAVVAGEVSMVFDSMTGPLPHIRAGKLRAIGYSGKQRSAVLPEVPTIAETVLPGFDYEAWNGVIAPAGVPRDIAARLAGDLGRSVATPDVNKRLSDLGYIPLTNTPDQFAAIIASDLAKFGKIIKEAGIKAD